MAVSFTVFLNPNFNASERQAIGIAMVDYILDRTSRGRGVNNRPFGSGYAKSYQEHKDFIDARKSASPINLELSGDMLASLRVMDFSLAGKIVIGITAQRAADKAVWMREKGYNFIGMSQGEQDTIVSRFARPTQQEILRRINNG